MIQIKSGQHNRTHKIRPAGTNGQKPPTEVGFAVPTSGTARYGKTGMKMERPEIP
jgi:hypothetical protein